MDNFFTGTKENVAHLMDKPNFELMRHDVVNPILLEVDEIYHLACPASPVHYKCAAAAARGRPGAIPGARLPVAHTPVARGGDTEPTRRAVRCLSLQDARDRSR